MTEPEIEPTNLSDTVVRGAGLAGAGYVLAQVFTLGFYLVLARIASPEDFGEFAAGSLLVSVGLLFTESGMLAALIHRPDRIDEAASTATVVTALSGLGLSLLALAAAPLVGLLFDSGRIGSIAAATSGLLLIRSLAVVPEALLQRQFSFLRRVDRRAGRRPRFRHRRGDRLLQRHGALGAGDRLLRRGGGRRAALLEPDQVAPEAEPGLGVDVAGADPLRAVRARLERPDAGRRAGAGDPARPLRRAPTPSASTATRTG